MVGERHTHHSARCSWYILLPRRGARRLSRARWLDCLLSGLARRYDLRSPLSPFRCRQHSPRLDTILTRRYGSTCTTVSYDGNHGGDVRLVERGRWAVSLAGYH